MPLAAAQRVDSVFSEIDFVAVYLAGGCEDYFEEASKLASSIMPENGWPELLPFMFQCVGTMKTKW